MASDSNKDINNETEVLDENSKKECHKCKLLEEENRKLEEENRKLVDEIEKFNNDLIGNKDFNKTLAAIIDKHKKEIKSKDDKIESKDEEIKSKDKEIKSKDDEIINLKKKHQYELGSAKTFRLSDDDKNNPTNLNEDISQIQEDLEFYVTNLRPKTDIEINLKNISRLLNDSKVKKSKITYTLNSSSELNDYMPLIKAVLQRHVLRTILDYFDKYNRKNSLELQFLKQAEDLENLAKRLEKERTGSDAITSALSVKIRQQSFAALGNRGFSNIKETNTLHDFIKDSKDKLNKEMESYRKILDAKKKEDVEKKVTDLIREVVRLFYFRLKTQEPIAEFKWLDDNDEFEPNQMEEYDEGENENGSVEMCIFPLIYKNDESQPNKLQAYTKATVFIRNNSLLNSSDKNPNSIAKFFRIFI
ncbi:hypothetical protein RhiirA5_363860 [Rhizophagus irregularis]|uniref:Uncharacterized protein n=1 Tax=Rhizophagus irregularis TaxID=588596 RepID=A0A2N1MF78_9GLOM|nr:hypothetical protein RhiirA5_363860 [Rhizophagus irregularis]PKK60209.1 hypothetical protein RhiirC2_762000 [Rhizophagus irregularis]CAB4387241.1 unnamed protein product [Rhizophagus irregularis]CAB5203929.1 unnamed protein product [Rhizophagus irregularis]CAB5385870.1 unnamed protein product [Rhizophagus irregularis]